MKPIKLLILLILNLLFLTSCSLEQFTSEEATYNPFKPATYSYNYYYKNALYDFQFDFLEDRNFKVTVTDQSVAPSSQEKRVSTVTGAYTTNGRVLTMDIKSVSDDLNVAYSEAVDDEPIDLIFEVDENGNLTLIHLSALFPLLPDNILLEPVAN